VNLTTPNSGGGDGGDGGAGGDGSSGRLKNIILLAILL